MKQTFKMLLLSGIFVGLTACSAISEFTSSTSSTLDAATPDITLNNFIDRRFEAIKNDAARGGGENIDALAQLLGEKNPDAFAQFMRVNYDKIFANLEQPEGLVARIHEISVNSEG